VNVDDIAGLVEIGETGVRREIPLINGEAEELEALDGPGYYLLSGGNIWLKLTKDPVIAEGTNDSGDVSLLDSGEPLSRSHNTEGYLDFYRWDFVESAGDVQAPTLYLRLPESTGLESQPTTIDFDGEELTYSADYADLQLGEWSHASVWWNGIDITTVFVRLPVEEFSLEGLSSVSPDVQADLQALYGSYQPLNSLGTGGAVVPHASVLISDSSTPQYVTLLENNHPEGAGAVSIHIVEIDTERYRGAIKTIEAADVFDEKINLQHTGDFGANTEDIYYQWWIREVDSLSRVGLPGEDLEWQLYTQGLGLHQIEFKGRPDITLADKLFYVRYGEKSEIDGATDSAGVLLANQAATGSVADSTWRLVDINSATDSAVLDESPMSRVPYQWAGASNSPQLQADGSRKYIPQLVMGWVKRVLDRINPYEARYTDFYNNESPATYSSQIQIAGAPFIGKVALNSDKDVIEGVGLIQLYETVLARARELTLDIPGASTGGTNQALLLAATRLAFLYDLLAREAYSDAQDPTVRVTSDNGLSSTVSYLHAFMNQEASLLHEELALLRGTDFLKAYPAYNRLFWNYVKGEGEAAYNANYNVSDENQDGFINEFDAAALYPQGHGDAWGHFLSSNKMHYELLRNNAFDWEAKAELYSLLDNVIESDYLDEKSFGRIAAAKARAGNEIVRASYREAYVNDPDGQWQGYTDSVNPARAWGVSEWSKRAGQGAYFDWLVGNNVVPETAETEDNLHKIDRVTTASELAEVAGAHHAIQQTLDEANSGLNPLGFDANALNFDIDPLQYDGGAGGRKTHFEQVYEKAVIAAQNARTALDFASRSDSDLRRIADDTETLRVDAIRQDLDFRNRLIEIFGTPYSGTIGAGQVFDEGYEGPDTLLYQYVDHTDTEDYIPGKAARFTTLKDTTFSTWASDYADNDWRPNFYGDGTQLNDDIAGLIERFYVTKNFEDLALDGDTSASETADVLSIEVQLKAVEGYTFQAPADGSWGARSSYGRLHKIVNEMIVQHLSLKQSIRDYAAYTEQLQILSAKLEREFRAHEAKSASRSEAGTLNAISAAALVVGSALEALSSWSWELAWQSGLVAEAYFPGTVGLSNDVTSVGRGASKTFGAALSLPTRIAWGAGLVGRYSGEIGLALVEAKSEHDEQILSEYLEALRTMEEVGSLISEEEGKRLAISTQVARLEGLAQKYQSTLAEGFRLLDEREAFNIAMAGKVQRNRYSDMVYRISRNEALSKYQDAFQNAQKYAWHAARAYDYETSLSDGSPYAATSIVEDLVKIRTLGIWAGDQPSVGQGGLSEALAQLKGNFDTLKGQLGVNNPQIETGKLSLRQGHFRIRSGSDQRWQSELADSIVNLWDVPEFRSYCRPFATRSAGAQPGIVIEFDTKIQSGLNVFGEVLGGNDHAYSSSSFATKIRSAGVFFEGYADSGLSTSPRVYLVPAGADMIHLADSPEPQQRFWNVLEQRIPAPFVINQRNLEVASFMPSIDANDGSFSDIRRISDFRAYHDSGTEALDAAQLARDSRLIGRSVANTKWLLIIPGGTLHSDQEYGLEQFIETVKDIKLVFETYSHTGN